MADFRSFRVEAVVLRHSDWGEADRLVVLYTLQQGKIRALAKGVRKLTSRKAGHLEPFTHVTLQLSKGRDLPIVTQAETLNAHLRIREDLTLTGCAAYAIELLDRFIPDEDIGVPGVFRLLVETLGRLAPAPDPWLVVRYYEMRLLDFLGFRPRLFECANCGREILPEDQFFSYQAGGVICPFCAERVKGLRPVSLEALKFLRHFQRSPWKEAARARPDAAVHRELEILMQGYFTHLLERELNTPGFLKSIRKQG